VKIVLNEAMRWHSACARRCGDCHTGGYSNADDRAVLQPAVIHLLQPISHPSISLGIRINLSVSSSLFPIILGRGEEGDDRF